jgi:hypothetical protein
MTSKNVEEFFSTYEAITVSKVSGQKMFIFNCEKYPAFVEFENFCFPTGNIILKHLFIQVYTIAEFPEII